jgi:hypothetical protein
MHHPVIEVRFVSSVTADAMTFIPWRDHVV